MGGRLGSELRLWGQWTPVPQSSKQNSKRELCDGDKDQAAVLCSLNQIDPGLSSQSLWLGECWQEPDGDLGAPAGVGQDPSRVIRKSLHADSWQLSLAPSRRRAAPGPRCQSLPLLAPPWPNQSSVPNSGVPAPAFATCLHHPGSSSWPLILYEGLGSKTQAWPAPWD